MESARPIHDFATCGCVTVSKPSVESLDVYYARKRATAVAPVGESAIMGVAAPLSMPEIPATFQPDQAKVD